MIIIDGETFDVPVVDMKRRADFLDKYAERTEDGVLQRELIGVYFNYQVSFGAYGDPNEYDRLWAKLTEAEEFHDVTVPGEGGQYTFRAYFSSIQDQLRKSKEGGNNFWKGLQVNFTAQSPART